MTSTIDNPKAVSCALGNAALFASEDDLRPVLNCASVEADGERIRFVATDSYVLLVEDLALSVQPQLGDDPVDQVSWSALIHRDDLSLAKRALSGLKDTPISFAREEDGVLMRFAQRELLMPSFVRGDVDFPNWETLFTHERASVKTLGLTTWTLRRLGALRHPGFDRDELPYRCEMGGEHGPVEFEIPPNDLLAIRGLVMPAGRQR